MRLAYTIGPGRGDTDLVLFEAARRLEAQGVRICGTVQVNTVCDEDGPCDMDVEILPSRQVIRISQSLGKNARGCRLDANALEDAVAVVSSELHKGADLLIVNKFGKHEVEGRGFRTAIAQAIELDVPVLVGLNKMNEAEFLKFSGGIAERISADQQGIDLWCSDLASDVIAQARP